jgi:hypothetical protein
MRGFLTHAFQCVIPQLFYCTSYIFIVSLALQPTVVVFS